jgi:hypothetical protein
MKMTVSRQDRVWSWLKMAGAACAVLICAPSYWLVADIDGGCLFGDLWPRCPAWCPSSMWIMALGVAAQVLIVALAAFAQWVLDIDRCRTKTARPARMINRKNCADALAHGT